MKIFCIGRNYVAHAKELNNKVPDSPVIFMKPPTALLKNNQPFYIPDFSDNVHYEAELVIRIGKNGKKVAPQFAHRYINKVTVGIDFTARDIQKKMKENSWPWELAKGFDHSAVIGEWTEMSGEEVLNGLDFSLSLNGETVQAVNSSEMIFSIDHLISYISQHFTLQQGDLIFTGTPEGVGQIHIDDRLEGFLGEKKVFSFSIK